MLETRLLRSIKILLYAVLFAPAVVTYSTAYPFLHGKVFWIEIFIELLLGLYLVLVLTSKDYWPKKTPLFWAMSAFIGSLVISTIFSVDRSISFWGDWSRMTGLILYLHLFAFFIIFSSVIKKDYERRNYLIFFSLLGTVLSIFAWIQRYNTKFLKAVWVGGRVGSTIDNPAFFAIFLIFIIFINLWLASVVSKKYRLLFFLSAIFNFLTVFITQTRGVILGLFAGMAIFAFFRVIKSTLKWKIGLAIFLALIFAAFIFKPTYNILTRAPGLGRVLESTLIDSTAQTRLLTWKIATRAWLARPITGWGHEAFYAAFNKFYKPEFVRFSFSETWFDKSHNIFLDLLSMNGLLGFFSYISIFIFGYIVISRSKKLPMDSTSSPQVVTQNNAYINKSLVPLYISLITTYFVGNFFEFDTPASLLAIFFIFALIYSYSNTNDANEARLTPAQIGRPIQPSVVALIIIIISILLWFVPIKSVIASRGLDRASDLIRNNFAQGASAYREIIVKNRRFSEPAALEYAMRLNQLLLTDDEAVIKYKNDFDLTMNKLEDSARRHKFDVNYVLAYSLLANTRATMETDFAKKAEKLLEENRLMINPGRQQVLLMLGETKLLLDKNDEAINILKQAQDLAPTAREISYRLAIVYFASGLEEEGFAQLKKAKILGMADIGAQPLLVLISVNASRGNWVKVAELYEKSVKLEPNNAKLFAQMATAYATIGNKKRAREAVARAVELDPKLKGEGEQFLRQVK